MRHDNKPNIQNIPIGTKEERESNRKMLAALFPERFPDTLFPGTFRIDAEGRQEFIADTCRPFQWPQPHQWPEPQPLPPQYEYRIVETGLFADERELNVMGREGWELVGECWDGVKVRTVWKRQVVLE